MWPDRMTDFDIAQTRALVAQVRVAEIGRFPPPGGCLTLLGTSRARAPLERPWPPVQSGRRCADLQRGGRARRQPRHPPHMSTPRRDTRTASPAGTWRNPCVLCSPAPCWSRSSSPSPRPRCRSSLVSIPEVVTDEVAVRVSADTLRLSSTDGDAPEAHRSDPIVASIPFTMVGFRLPEGVDTVRVRTAGDDGAWGEWYELERNSVEDGPDAGTEEAAADRSRRQHRARLRRRGDPLPDRDARRGGRGRRR